MFVGICMFVLHFLLMKILGKIPLLIVAVSAWIIIISSCANQGMPTGGPKDSIPPILIETNPDFKATNFTGDNIRLTFNEYIDISQISEELVISPPLLKRPIIRTKSRSLIVQFNEELLDSTTYSLDFKDAVADNNERNPYKNLRFSFSTWDVYDSLRVAGRVVDGFTLEPIEKALIILQKNLHDSAVFKVRPNYIAKTDKDGFFMVDNISEGKYNIFSLVDNNTDMLYNEGAEQIAFWDSIIVPSAHFHEEIDTLVTGLDSMLIMGHTHFYPEPLYLRQFTEDIFEQYFDTYERKTRNSCQFIFSESVADSFMVNLVDLDAQDWYLLEPNKNMDTIQMWITDTLIGNIDTLFMEVSYFQLDSTKQLYVQKDTVEMTFTDNELKESKRKKRREDDEEEKPEPVPQFNWKTNISGTFELNHDILLTAPEPVNTFDSTKVMLVLVDDTTKTPLNITFQKDSVLYRTYRISYDWEPETSYTFIIDSAACQNIYGITSQELSKKFTTREEDYYGTIICELENVNSPLIVQLVENSDEKVLQQKFIEADGEVNFSFLPPEKYKIKVVYDDNNNKKWDTGSYQDKYQPEKVMYVNKVIKVRSNWENVVPIDATIDFTFTKNVVDEELEEQRRKEAEEKARLEREQQNSGQPMQNNLMQGGNDRSNRNMQIRRQ